MLKYSDASSALRLFLSCIGCLLILLPVSNASWADSVQPSPPRGDAAPDAASSSKLRIADEITGWFVTADFAGSFNNPGVRLIGRGGYRWRLYGHKNPALANNFFQMNAVANVTPATIGGGPNLAIQPLSILKLGINYSFRFYFPAFLTGVVFKDMETVKQLFVGNTDFLDGEGRMASYRDAQIARNNNERVIMHAHILRLHWLFQIRIKGIVAQSLGTFEFWFAGYQDPNNSQFFYEAANDLVIKKQDQVLVMLNVIGYEWQNLRFLAVNTYTKAFQSQEEIVGIGPAVQWTVTPQWKAFKNPFFLFVVRWWAVHRFRSGPMPNLAVIFQTDFAL